MIRYDRHHWLPNGQPAQRAKRVWACGAYCGGNERSSGHRPSEQAGAPRRRRLFRCNCWITTMGACRANSRGDRLRQTVPGHLPRFAIAFRLQLWRWRARGTGDLAWGGAAIRGAAWVQGSPHGFRSATDAVRRSSQALKMKRTFILSIPITWFPRTSKSLQARPLTLTHSVQWSGATICMRRNSIRRRAKVRACEYCRTLRICEPRAETQRFSPLVPTLRVGTHWTAALRRMRRRASEHCVPTQSMGTRLTSSIKFWHSSTAWK